MNKLRSLRAKIPSSPSTSSLPGAKLTKAFKFNKEAKVIPNSQSRWGANPFHDGPNLEDPSLPRVHLILHCVALFFTFLAICMTGAVAAFQIKWFSISGGTAFTLFLLITAIIFNIGLVTIPSVYDRWDRLKSANGFLAVPRTRLIIHAFGALLSLLSAFIITISAWTAKGCKNANNDPHAGLGDDYKSDLSQWCQTKKASGVLDWFSFTAWLVLLILTIIEWKRDRDDDRGFTPPDAGISNVNFHERLARPRDDEEATMAEGPYAEKEPMIPEATLKTGYESYGYSRAKLGGEDDLESSAFGRPSVDAYGAFDGDMPGHNTLGGTTLGGQSMGGGTMSRGDSGEASRTMQLAYNDPYAHIRQSLLGGPNPYAPVDAQQTPVQAQSYAPTPVPVQVHQVPVQPQSPFSPQQYGRGVLPQPPTYQQPYGYQ